MDESDGGRARLCFLILSAVWLVLVVPGIFYGLPQGLDPDEPFFVKGALRLLTPRYLDPEWYGAPASVLMDILAPLYAAFYLGAKVFGEVSSPVVFAEQHFHILVLIGRAVTALSVLAACLVLYRILKESFGPGASLAGAATLLVSPQVVHHSQITRMDVFLILFLLLVLYYSIKILEDLSLKHCILSGLALGAAVVSKYPGVIGAAPITLALVMAYGNGRISLRVAAKRLFASALASVCIAFVLAPYLFLNFSGVLEDVLHEARPRHLSGTDAGFLPDVRFFAVYALTRISGAGVAIAGACGLILGLFGKNKARVALFVCFGVCFLVFISALSLRWVRWALPLVPVLSVGVTVVLDAILRLRASRMVTVVPVIVVSICVLVPPAIDSALNTALKAAGRDTRVAALDWIHGNIPPGSSVALETYAPQLSMDGYHVLVPFAGELRRAEEVWRFKPRPPAFFGSFGSNGISVDRLGREADYVVISDWEDRYREEREHYPVEYSVYMQIRKRFEEVRVFYPTSMMLGRKVSVFKKSARS